MHPRGIRFVKKRADNRDAVRCAVFLASQHRLNGWHSWLDVGKQSGDWGLWVLFNTRTQETYVQKMERGV